MALETPPPVSRIFFSTVTVTSGEKSLTYQLFDLANGDNFTTIFLN